MKTILSFKDWIGLFRFICFAFSVVVLTLSQGNAEENSRKKTILVLDAHSAQMTWARLFRDGFESEMASNGQDVTRHWEFLDAIRFKSHFNLDSFARHLLDKYTNVKLDYVVALGAASVKFLTRHPDFFPDVPVLLLAGNSSELVEASAARKQSVSAAVDANLTSSLDYIIEQHRPGKIYVLGETQSPHVVRYLDELKAKRGTSHMGVDIEYLLDIPMDDLKQKLSRLTGNEAAFYVAILRDRKGQTLLVKDYIFDLTRASNIPIFSYWGTWIGKQHPAILGGLVLDPENLGTVFAHNVLGNLFENKQIDIEQIREGATRATYDYRQMQRFGITQDDLPHNAVILGKKEVPFLNDQQWLVLGVLSSSLVAALWIFAVRRQVAVKTQKLTKANQELSVISNTDALTQLANRRRFDQLIEHECERSGRMEQALAVALIDIDQFKNYNDLYGHQQGDTCLQIVAEAIQSYCRRAGDNCARYGGEEFALISVGNDLARAESQLNSLRKDIEDLHLDHADSEAGIVTVSIGVAVVHKSYPYDAEVLIREADKALYQAKRAGRNRVVSAGLD
jgi:diguanylate cyclase (GGDEF)-like protein